jgi:sensor c-di-GMP phosphodiesterase-like protein
VIVEGVETVEQALALSAMNCQEAQGFFFSKPLAARDFLQWVAARSARSPLSAPNGKRLLALQ